MSEFYRRYYPTLCIRRAEMKAMEKLPPSEKAKMLPIALLAPWLNSIEFKNTFEVIQKSVGPIPTIVDLDRGYRSDSQFPSRKYFRSLLGGAGAAERWIELIEGHENYIPTVQLRGFDDAAVELQIETFKRLGRGRVFRVEFDGQPDLERVLGFLDRADIDQQLMVLDFGWHDYSLEQQAICSRVIERLISISDQMRFVVVSSNFPNDFTDLDNMAPVPIDSRKLYQSLLATYGNYQMYYGDWASTKPRKYDGGGSKPLPRIDYPTKDRWIISRSKEEEWDFYEAAKRVTRLAEWRDRPAVWGSSMIEKTALNLPGGISTGPQAIASRVNIHLFLQNNYTADRIADIPTEAAWVDPIPA